MLAEKFAVGSLGLRTLRIIDCANVSVQGLKDAVNTRATKYGTLPTTWDEWPLAHLTVCGSEGCGSIEATSWVVHVEYDPGGWVGF